MNAGGGGGYTRQDPVPNKASQVLTLYLDTPAPGVINSIAWRGDLMVLGDSAGNISFWDLKSRYLVTAMSEGDAATQQGRGYGQRPILL